MLLAGFVLLFLQGISELIRNVAILKGIVPDEHAHISPHEAALREAELMMGHPHEEHAHTHDTATKKHEDRA